MNRRNFLTVAVQAFAIPALEGVLPNLLSNGSAVFRPEDITYRKYPSPWSSGDVLVGVLHFPQHCRCGKRFDGIRAASELTGNFCNEEDAKVSITGAIEAVWDDFMCIGIATHGGCKG